MVRKHVVFAPFFLWKCDLNIPRKSSKNAHYNDIWHIAIAINGVPTVGRTKKYLRARCFPTRPPKMWIPEAVNYFCFFASSSLTDNAITKIKIPIKSWINSLQDEVKKMHVYSVTITSTMEEKLKKGKCGQEARGFGALFYNEKNRVKHSEIYHSKGKSIRLPMIYMTL